VPTALSKALILRNAAVETLCSAMEPYYNYISMLWCQAMKQYCPVQRSGTWHQNTNECLLGPSSLTSALRPSLNRTGCFLAPVRSYMMYLLLPSRRRALRCAVELAETLAVSRFHQEGRQIFQNHICGYTEPNRVLDRSKRTYNS